MATPMQNGPKLHWKKSRQFILTIWAGAVLSWGGLIGVLDRTGYLPQSAEDSAWNWVLLGIGLLVITGVLWSLASPDIRPSTASDYIGAVLLLILVANFAIVLPPLFAIAFGWVIVIRMFMRGE